MDLDRIYNILSEDIGDLQNVPDCNVHDVYQLILDAFYEAKLHSMNRDRQMFDISRYLACTNQQGQDVLRLYEINGTKLTHGEPIDRLVKQVRRDRCPLFLYMKRYFGFQSKFSLLVCHNTTDIHLTMKMMEHAGTFHKLESLITK